MHLFKEQKHYILYIAHVVNIIIYNENMSIIPILVKITNYTELQLGSIKNSSLFNCAQDLLIYTYKTQITVAKNITFKGTRY